MKIPRFSPSNRHKKFICHNFKSKIVLGLLIKKVLVAFNNNVLMLET